MARCRRFGAGLWALALASGLAAAAGAQPQPRPPGADVPSAPFLRVETGTHESVVNRITTDPNGRFFVTVSDDKTVRFWALSDGHPLSVLRVPIAGGDEGALHAAALSPDGRRLLVGGATCASWDRAFCLYLFDVTTQQLKSRLPNLPAVVNHIAFSPDGQRFAVAFGGRAGVKLYDASNGRVVGEDTAYADRTTWVAFAPDGRFATASFDGHVRLYDAAARRTHDYAALGRRPYSVAFSPDGGALAVGYLRQARVDVLDGRDLQWRRTPPDPSVPEGSFSVVAWGPDATLYAGGTARQAGGMYVVRRWPGGTGAPTDIAASRDTLTALAPLADGSVIFGSADPRVGRIDTAGRILFSVDRAGLDFRDVAQRTLATSNDGLVVDFHPFGWSSPLRFQFESRTLSGASGRPPSGSPASRTLVQTVTPPAAVATAPAPAPTVTSWRNGPAPRIRGIQITLEAEELSRSAAATADGTRVVLGTDYYVRVYDGASARELHRIGVPAAAWGVTVSADGRMVVSALGDGTLRWFRLDPQGRLEESVSAFVHADGQRWVAWTAEGFFDHADVGGKELVGYQVNRGKAQAPDWYSFAQVYRLMYAPDLVLQKARGREQAVIAARLQEVGDLGRHLAAGAPPQIDLVELCYRTGGPPICVPLTEAAETRDIVVQAKAPPATTAAGTAVDAVLPAGVHTVDLKYTLIDRGGGVGIADVFLNDRNVGRSDQGQRRAGPRTQAVPVDAGENRLQVRVYDRGHSAYMQSRTVVVAPGRTAATQTATAPRAPAGAEEAKPAPPAPRLFVVAVGINKYSSEITELRFAVPDARSFAQIIQQRAARLYHTVTPIELYDRDATVARVADALERVGRDARSQDTVLVYLAGHGVVIDRQYYFVTSDVTDPDKIAQQALGEKRLVSLLAGIPAKNGFVFLDTCHAGAFSLDYSSQLIHESGRYVLAAASSLEGALDSYDNKNGVFATAVLRGLGGEARPGGREVNQIDLGFFVAPRVAVLAREKGHTQSARFKIAAENAEPFPLTTVE